MIARIVWSEGQPAMDFGRDHPMSPLRLVLTMAMARELGVLTAPGVELVAAEAASDADLALVHEEHYLAAVRRAGESGAVSTNHGLGTDDDPVFPGMHEAAARQVGGTLAAALAVWRGEVTHAVNLQGGMHHAMPDHASGFCVYNDAAVAIRRLLAEGAERVAYVDLDAHHGDGVEAVFWDDPRVLTVSIHESGATLFPGTGHPTDVGGPHARGSVVNVALPAGTGDAGWQRAVAAVAEPVVRAFAPQVVFSQHGCDSHPLDPLANLRVSVDAQRWAVDLVHGLAHELADGRWIALGGGGYAVAHVVPRAWTHVMAVAGHVPLALTDPVPPAWFDAVTGTTGLALARTMGDGVEAVAPRPWARGYDPGDPVDRMIYAARRAVFDWYDLDPVYD